VSNENWNDQESNDIFNHCAGSTVLIKFKDTFNGITLDSGETVDISWIRWGGIITATSGDYKASDIKSWKQII